MSLDPALEEQLQQVIQQEHAMGLGDEANKLEQAVEGGDTNPAPAATDDSATVAAEEGEAEPQPAE